MLYQNTKNNNLLCFGFIRESKGIKEIIKTFNEVNEKSPSGTLSICGNCEDKKYLEELKKEIINNGLKRKVIIKNKFLDNKEIKKCFSEAKIVIEFPKDEGGPSGSINMAAAYGKPTICADTTYLKEYVKESKAGLLVEKSNYKELGKKIIKLLKDNKKIKQMENNAKKYCKKNSFSVVSKTISKEYKK